MDERIKLLLAVVRKRFTSVDSDESDKAIITAIEGLKWLAGQDSVVDEAWLRAYLETYV